VRSGDRCGQFWPSPPPRRPIHRSANRSFRYCRHVATEIRGAPSHWKHVCNHVLCRSNNIQFPSVTPSPLRIGPMSMTLIATNDVRCATLGSKSCSPTTHLWRERERGRCVAPTHSRPQKDTGKCWHKITGQPV
jgi:hypothetical protein